MPIWTIRGTQLPSNNWTKDSAPKKQISSFLMRCCVLQLIHRMLGTKVGHSWKEFHVWTENYPLNLRQTNCTRGCFQNDTPKNILYSTHIISLLLNGQSMYLTSCILAQTVSAPIWNFSLLEFQLLTVVLPRSQIFSPFAAVLQKQPALPNLSFRRTPPSDDWGGATDLWIEKLPQWTFTKMAQVLHWMGHKLQSFHSFHC